MASWGAVLSLDWVRSQNRKRWSGLWQSRVKVFGDLESQKALDAAFRPPGIETRVPGPLILLLSAAEQRPGQSKTV